MITRILNAIAEVRMVKAKKVIINLLPDYEWTGAKGTGSFTGTHTNS